MTNAELTFDDLMSFSSASGPENADAAGPAPLPSRRAARLQRLAEAQVTGAPAAAVAAAAPAAPVAAAAAPAPAAAAPVAAVPAPVEHVPAPAETPVAPLRAVPPLADVTPADDVAPVAPLRAVQPAAPLEPIVPAEPVAASRHVHVGPASDTAAPAPAVRQRPSAATSRSEKADKHGRFYRPELHSRWDRMSGSLVLRITVITVLLAGTGALAYVALTRFAGV